MDTGSDFIQPEFLNILFFQQKNLVVFPYVDLKHLHGLEIFTAGYNIVDLESTALHNLKEILEFESSNSYSQNPTLYFIFNVDRGKVKELMALDGIRCIINSNENISNLANGSRFVFFNKKNNQFLNYNLTPKELEFETSLISDSQDEDILQENIQKIKIAATRIFKELNQTGTLETLPDILSEYDKKHWSSILEFTSQYYDINIPDTKDMKFKTPKKLNDFSDEYEVLISTNRALGKEFIQLLHEYRSKKVNPAHLELDELYNPQKLYGYLKNHHWKEGIPNDFVEEWYQMNISGYQLTESDQVDFENIVRKLGLDLPLQDSSTSQPSLLKPEHKSDIPPIPSLKTNWNAYKNWILERMNELDKVCKDKSRPSKIRLTILNELSDLLQLLKKNIEEQETSQPIPELIRQVINSNMKKLKIPDWVKLYGVSDKFRFVLRFITQFDVLYEDNFGKNGITKTPPRIKNFKFPKNLEDKLLKFNSFRNEITHEEMANAQINKLLHDNKKHINNTYLHFLSFLLRFQVRHVAKKYNISDTKPLNQFIINNYIINTVFSQQEINKIQEFLEKNDRY